MGIQRRKGLMIGEFSAMKLTDWKRSRETKAILTNVTIKDTVSEIEL